LRNSDLKTGSFCAKNKGGLSKHREQAFAAGSDG
jgi:hypothetical protein